MRRGDVGTGAALALGLVLAACSTPPEIQVRPIEPSDTAAPATTTEPTEPTDPTEPPDTTEPPEPGSSDDIGDPITPGAGNPGFDVQHYLLDLAYDPAQARLDAVVTVEAEATADLDAFTLDFADMDVTAVEVGGAEAEHEHGDLELHITPAEPIERGDEFVVTVTYGGESPDKLEGPFGGISLGWIDTGEGAHVLNQPDGARQWLPSSDHPSDKATFSFRVTVPKGLTVVTNGRATGTVPEGEAVEWRSENPEPMATYLVQIAVGRFDVVEREVGDLLHRSAVPEGTISGMAPYLDLADELIPFFESYFGPYPFDRYGLLVTDSSPGLALETQTLPIFSSGDLPPLAEGGAPDPIAHLFVSHELAHMWYGDQVSPDRWEDLWLNEGFATYGHWLWLDDAGFTPLEEEARLARQQMPELREAFGATDEPRAESLFSPTVYEGGAVVLHALRGELGDDVFFGLLQKWVVDNAGASVTTDDFVAAASDAAGRDLTRFFDVWLGEGELPPYPG